MLVLSYRMSYNPAAHAGKIEIKLQNNKVYNFGLLNADDFNGLCNILNQSPVFWNGKELFTGIEPVN